MKKKIFITASLFLMLLLAGCNNSDNREYCDIKGNINSGGEKIYHLPGCASYDKTKIDSDKGERWFCSESDARNAGWRKASNCP